MQKKNIWRGDDTIGQPPEVNESELSPHSAALEGLIARETELFARELAADRRQDAADQSEAAARAKAELGAITEVHLREANERLVIATIRAQTMTEAAKHATAQMVYMAQHDFLTGLPNRALLSDRLAQSIALAQRHGKRVALLYLDLDHFKHINDSLGHAVGDQLLQSSAKRLQACLPRHSDTVSRQGGDEFVVLLAEVEAAQDAVVAAKKIAQGDGRAASDRRAPVARHAEHRH